MARFKVYGADSKTGEDTTITVTADNSDDAEAIASRRGLLVEKVVEVDEVPATPSQTPPTQPGSSAGHPTAANAEAGHSSAAPAVNVHMPQRTSSLGVVSLILGVLGLLLCWIPVVGVIAFPLAGIGLLMAGIAIIVAFTRKGSGIGWPIGGGIVNALALLVAIIQATVIVGAGEAMNQAADEMAKQVEKRQQERERLETEWDPPEGFAKNNLNFSLGALSVKKIPLESFEGSSTTQNAHLIVPVQVQNNSDRRKIDIDELQPDFTTERAQLTDDAGNEYDAVGLPAMSDLGGEMQTSTTVMPGESETLQMFFKRPVSSAENIKLKLPAERFGGKGNVVLETKAP